MLILKSIALSSVIIFSAANAGTKQDIQNFTGFYRAKTAMGLTIKNVGVVSRCKSAVYEDSIMQISYDENNDELKVRKQYEYLSYPFDQDDESLIYVADVRETIPLINSETRKEDIQYSRLSVSSETQSSERSYMQTNFEVTEIKLEATKLLIPKKIGGVLKGIQHKYVLDLSETRNQLSMRVANSGARVLGLDVGFDSNCHYERISEGEYLRLSHDYDYRRSAR